MSFKIWSAVLVYWIGYWTFVYKLSSNSEMYLQTLLWSLCPISKHGNVIGKFATNLIGNRALKSDLKLTISKYHSEPVHMSQVSIPPKSSTTGICSMAKFWGEMWGGAHLPGCDRFAPPLKSRAPEPLGKVSMIDQSENLTFFG
jgi:hypothetical protein